MNAIDKAPRPRRLTSEELTGSIDRIAADIIALVNLAGRLFLRQHLPVSGLISRIPERRSAFHVEIGHFSAANRNRHNVLPRKPAHQHGEPGQKEAFERQPESRRCVHQAVQFLVRK